MNEQLDISALRAEIVTFGDCRIQDALALCDAVLVARAESRDSTSAARRWKAQHDEYARLAHDYATRLNAVGAVLDAHGPDGMNSAGYDLWSDVNHALLP